MADKWVPLLPHEVPPAMRARGGNGSAGAVGLPPGAAMALHNTRSTGEFYKNPSTGQVVVRMELKTEADFDDDDDNGPLTTLRHPHMPSASAAALTLGVTTHADAAAAWRAAAPDVTHLPVRPSSGDTARQVQHVLPQALAAGVLASQRAGGAMRDDHEGAVPRVQADVDKAAELAAGAAYLGSVDWTRNAGTLAAGAAARGVATNPQAAALPPAMPSRCPQRNHLGMLTQTLLEASDTTTSSATGALPNTQSIRAQGRLLAPQQRQFQGDSDAPGATFRPTHRDTLRHRTDAAPQPGHLSEDDTRELVYAAGSGAAARRRLTVTHGAWTVPDSRPTGGATVAGTVVPRDRAVLSTRPLHLGDRSGQGRRVPQAPNAARKLRSAVPLPPMLAGPSHGVGGFVAPLAASGPSLPALPRLVLTTTVSGRSSSDADGPVHHTRAAAAHGARATAGSAFGLVGAASREVAAPATRPALPDLRRSAFVAHGDAAVAPALNRGGSESLVPRWDGAVHTGTKVLPAHHTDLGPRPAVPHAPQHADAQTIGKPRLLLPRALDVDEDGAVGGAAGAVTLYPPDMLPNTNPNASTHAMAVPVAAFSWAPGGAMQAAASPKATRYTAQKPRARSPPPLAMLSDTVHGAVPLSPGRSGSPLVGWGVSLV
jgi:hypothetical protein